MSHPKPLDTVPEIDPRVTDIAAQVRQMIANGNLDPGSCIGIVRAAAALGADWSIVEDVVCEIAKGADGVAGTSDDLIPQSTLTMLSALLGSGVVRDVVAWASEFTGPAAGGLLSGLLARLGGLVARLRSCFN